MTDVILAASAAASVAGVLWRVRRQLLSWRQVAGILALAALTIVLVIGLPAPFSGILTGGLVVAAAALTRDLEPRLDLVWMAAMGALLALLVYQDGAIALLGAAAALGLVLTLGRRGSPGGARGRFGVRVKAYDRHLLVCVDRPCKEAGALALHTAIGHDRRFRLANGVRVTPSGCLGYCQEGPIVWAEPEGTLYRHVEASSLDTLWPPAATRKGAPE